MYEVLVFLREAKLEYQFEANTQHHHIQYLRNGKQETGSRARVIEKSFDQPKLFGSYRMCFVSETWKMLDGYMMIIMMLVKRIMGSQDHRAEKSLW